MGNTQYSYRSKAIRLPQVEDVSHLDEAISFIETRLDAILIDKPEEGTSRAETSTNSAGVASSIEYGSYFLEKVGRCVKRHTCKIVKLNRDIQKVVIDILKGAEQIHWVGAGVGVVAYVFHQIDKISNNRNECVEFLCFMYRVVKHIKRRINHLPQEKLNDVVLFIVKGSFFCVSRIQSTNLSTFFSAVVDEEEIRSLQSQLTKKYPELEQYPDEDDKRNAFDLPEDVLRDLDELMSYVGKCLAKLTSTDKEGENRPGVDTTASGGMASSIKFGRDLVGNVLKRCTRYGFKIMSGETRKVVIDVLKEASDIHWVAAGLSIVAFVLQKADDASTNKEECVQFLRYMYGLAKHIKQLKGNIPQEKLHDVAEFIFKGSFFCVSRIQSTNLSSFFSSVVDVEEMKRLQSELGQKYRDLTLEAVTLLLNQMRRVLPPSQGKRPDAVGIDDAVSKVTDLLAIDDNVSTIAVVIYGIGGMGKTTLANAVFSCLDLKAYKYCSLIIKQDCSETDLKDLQQQILNDLFGQRLELTHYKRGQEEISKAFREAASQPLFLFIDNALRSSDLGKLLPEDLSGMPNGSRMLVTTRKLDETDILDERNIPKRLAYAINTLPPAEAKRLLSKKAFGNPDATFDRSLDIDDLVTVCGGIPLVLDLVGSRLRKHIKDPSTCNSTIRTFKDSLRGGERELTEKVVDVVYDSLQAERYKDAFLDIVAFFGKEEWSTVSYVVGADELVALQDAALLKKSKYGRVELHDVVLTRGRKLSETDRVTNPESLTAILEDPQRLEKLKGIWLPERSKFQLQAKDLDKMNKCLRILHLEGETKVIGVCINKFENLRYLEVDNGDCSPMELSKLPRLAIFEGQIGSDDRFSDLPDSLRRLRVKVLDSLGLDESFGNLSHLEELELSQANRYMTRLPQSFGQLKSLRHLTLKSFKEVTSLPATFGQLTNLKEMKIIGCTKLTSLPHNFGQLQSLEYLKIRGSQSLQRLSDDFGSLTCVAAIDASWCPVLEGKAVNQMIELKSLLMLDIKKSPMLIDRWEEIKEGHPLLVLTGVALPRIYNHSLSRAIFDEHSRFVNVDGVVREWSSSFPAGEEKIVFLVTCCDLCSLSNEEVCEMVKKKIAELSSKGFQIMYVGLMEQSEERIGETLRHLSQGTSGGASLCAWIPTLYKWKQFFGFSAYAIVMCKWPGRESPELLFTSLFDPVQLLRGVHTYIARAHITAGEKGKPLLQDLERIFPVGKDEEGAMTDFEGGFTSVYSRVFNAFLYL